MKYLKPILITFLLIGFAFGQEKDTVKIEELDIAQIEEKAVADAKTDISKSETIKRWHLCCVTSIPVYLGLAVLNGWFDIFDNLLGETDRITEGFIAMSLSLLTPFSAHLFIPVELPPNRIDEIADESDDYKKIYSSKYKSVIKTQRMKYHRIGLGVCCVIFIGLSLLFSLVG